MDVSSSHPSRLVLGKWMQMDQSHLMLFPDPLAPTAQLRPGIHPAKPASPSPYKQQKKSATAVKLDSSFMLWSHC